MSRSTTSLTALAPARADSTIRLELDGGRQTTLHLASWPLAEVSLRVVRLDEPTRLVDWCRRSGVADALVGGFYTPRGREPLGELRLDGTRMPSVPFLEPWHATRACLHVDGDAIRLARRESLAADPAGDLLQAGPLLVEDGEVVCRDGDDAEGFAAGSTQFDSDITDGRHPRAALALAADRVLAAACDGRTADEAGLTLEELARALVAAGAERALNLDGGGSTSLVLDGRLRNHPREQHGVELAGGRPIVTAIAFDGT